ncbi:hypothetical protein ALP72_02472 [Pseudomonas coronafaciens pv. coronafaciens]|uniref:hypothetical protein n=1 Tax=Pseudomonas coronafaciens TaxID=53409 RepID=UPI000EFFD412|nr:hypothetical protein [Pseudomonas coronafaciens]RMS13269.1 hypothetical protein ALP72_02472 [Pseudomonas coronafaciens pv. coronafaciens]
MGELIITSVGERRLTALRFQETTRSAGSGEWFANIRNPSKRRARQADLRSFADVEEFRAVSRAHVFSLERPDGATRSVGAKASDDCISAEFSEKHIHCTRYSLAFVSRLNLPL